MPPSSPSVLVIRLDAIGDALALTPLLAAFRERGIPADLVLRGLNASVFAAGAVREVLVAPFALRRDDLKNRAEIRRFGESLRTRAYSHVLVATEDASGYRLARAVGAPERVGFVNGWGKPLKTLWARSLLTSAIARTAGLDRAAPHESAVLFELARSLLGGAKPTRDTAQLRPLILESEPLPDSRVAFQVTDKWERLGIAFDDVVRTVQALAPLAEVRAFAPMREARYAERFAKATGIDVERFDDLASWKAAIAAASLFVAPDSGGVHVAGMVGTPVVAVFSASPVFSLQSARWAPWAAPYVNVPAAGDWPASVERAVHALRQRQEPTRR